MPMPTTDASTETRSIEAARTLWGREVQAQATPDQSCDVTVDMSHGRFAPVARYDCAGTVRFTDMAGRDMTDLVGSG